MGWLHHISIALNQESNSLSGALKTISLAHDAVQVPFSLKSFVWPETRILDHSSLGTLRLLALPFIGDIVSIQVGRGHVVSFLSTQSFEFGLELQPRPNDTMVAMRTQRVGIVSQDAEHICTLSALS